MQDRYRSITKYTDRLAAQFLELVARGYLISDAAAAIDVTPNAIHLWRKNRPGFDAAYREAVTAGLRIPELPEGPAVRRWERRLADAASQKFAPQSPNSPSPGV